jgi:hypothetical protein
MWFRAFLRLATLVHGYRYLRALAVAFAVLMEHQVRVSSIFVTMLAEVDFEFALHFLGTTAWSFV